MRWLRSGVICHCLSRRFVSILGVPPRYLGSYRFLLPSWDQVVASAFSFLGLHAHRSLWHQARGAAGLVRIRWFHRPTPERNSACLCLGLGSGPLSTGAGPQWRGSESTQLSQGPCGQPCCWRLLHLTHSLAMLTLERRRRLLADHPGAQRWSRHAYSGADQQATPVHHGTLLAGDQRPSWF